MIRLFAKVFENILLGISSSINMFTLCCIELRLTINYTESFARRLAPSERRGQSYERQLGSFDADETICRSALPRSI